MMQQDNTEKRVEPSGEVLMDLFHSLHSNNEIFFYHVRTVQDMMKHNSRSVSLDSSIKMIWEQMDQEGVNDLPVVDITGDPRKGTQKKVYVGVVRRRDLVAMVSRYAGALSQPDSDDRMMQVHLSNCDAIDRQIRPVPANLSIFTAIERMVNQEVETIAVVDGDRNYLGSLSVTDVLRCFLYLETLQRIRVSDSNQSIRLVDLFNNRGGSMPSDKMLESFVSTARDIMNDAFYTIPVTVSISDAIGLMERHRCHSLIVVDEGGNLKGVTTSTEIQLALPPIVRKNQRAAKFDPNRIFKMHSDDSPETRQVLSEKVSVVTITSNTVISENKPVAELAEMLSVPNAIDLPVLGSGNLIKGLVGRWELVKAFLAVGSMVKKGGLIGG